MSAVTPVPLSLSDDEDLSAVGQRMNVCMNVSAPFISFKLSKASGPAQSGSRPRPSSPWGNTQVSAKEVFPKDFFNQRTGSVGCELSTRRFLFAGSSFKSQRRFFQPKVAFHICPNATVSTEPVTSNPTYR